MKSRLFVLPFILLISFSAFGRADKTYLEWSEVRCVRSDVNTCYDELVDNIRAKTSGTMSVNGYSRFRLQDAKPQVVVISIHGLWWSTQQFSKTLQEYSQLEGLEASNIIELTLPGHIKAQAEPEYYAALEHNRPTASYREWIDAVRETLKIARGLADKTVILGHSTGALLGAIAAKESSDSVDGLLLIEPAIRIQDSMSWGVCLGNKLPRAWAEYIFNAIGKTLYKGMDLGMGCEVARLASRFFPPRYKDHGQGPRSQTPRVVDYTYYSKLSHTIKIPVILINNENDQTVSPAANQYFFQGLQGPKKYISINQDKTLPHSAFVLKSPKDQARQLLELRSWIR